jgi:hypothetical protein
MEIHLPPVCEILLSFYLPKEYFRSEATLSQRSCISRSLSREQSDPISAKRILLLKNSIGQDSLKADSIIKIPGNIMEINLPAVGEIMNSGFFLPKTYLRQHSPFRR